MTATRTKPLVSIVMPCLNEAATIAQCIRVAREAARKVSEDFEIVVADNGSTDGSREISAAEGARVVPIAEKGYGSALRGGIEAARGEFIVMGDSDGSYDFGDAVPIVKGLERGAELVIANRFLGGIRDGAMPWKNRYIGNPLLSGVGRLLFGGQVRDFHCGLRGFTRAAYDRMNLQTTGMEFASEMIIKSLLLGMRVEEVPTTLSPDGRGRPPHLRPLRDGWRHLRFMLLFSPRWLFLYPGLLLMAAGILAMAALLGGPLHVDGVTLDVHTLAFAGAAVILGFQAFAFALLCEAFAKREKLLPVNAGAWSDRISLEGGVIAGAIFVIAGLVASAIAFGTWQQRGFGNLDPVVMLRRVIPAVTCLTVGFQMILSSFFLGFLRVK